MNIIEKDYNWVGQLKPRKSTEYIVVHHAAARSCTPTDVHLWHLGNGWSGIGYHFFVSKAGVVYRGRHEALIGAHVQGYNESSIGICFEGDFEKENVPEAQEKAGIELLRFLLKRYNKAKVIRHKDLMSTSCPGKNFPDRILIEGMKPEEVKPKEVEDELKKAVGKVVAGLGLSSPAYWENHSDKYVHVLLKKMAEYIEKHP